VGWIALEESAAQCGNAGRAGRNHRTGHGRAGIPFPCTPVVNTGSARRSPGLRLYTEQPPQAFQPSEAIGSLPEVLRAFHRATGWPLRYVAGAPSKPSPDANWSAVVNGGSDAVGHFRMELPTADAAEGTEVRVGLEAARGLASALAGMLGELLQTRQALWQREAELAAGVPLVPLADEEKHLAERLEAVLRGGAAAVGCHAAALYLLDEATSKLKLRSCWGLPRDRFTAPARPLQGAVADLEAMLGHAVVLDDAGLLQHWSAPEDFAAAACVPVSSPTTILGTLWVFSNHARDFSDRQTNLLEIVAGRVAADLEREVLLQEAVAASQWKREIVAAERLQRSQLPTISPLLDDWDLAGWTAQAGPLGGDFHDWFCLPDGLLAIGVGHAMDRGIEAALAAGALKAALRAHGQYYREAQDTLKRLNLTLWTSSAGDQRATLFYGLIETATGCVCCASAGKPSVLVIRPNGWESFSQESPLLGQGPEAGYEQFGCQLEPGEVLVAFTPAVRDVAAASGKELGEAGVAECLARRTNLTAAELVALVRQRLSIDAGPKARQDQTVLVVKRR